MVGENGDTAKFSQQRAYEEPGKVFTRVGTENLCHVEFLGQKVPGEARRLKWKQAPVPNKLECQKVCYKRLLQEAKIYLLAGAAAQVHIWQTKAKQQATCKQQQGPGDLLLPKRPAQLPLSNIFSYYWKWQEALKLNLQWMLDSLNKYYQEKRMHMVLREATEHKIS